MTPTDQEGTTVPDDTPTTAPTTTTPAGNELDDQTATDVANLRDLLAEIKDRTERADEIKSRLRAQWRPGTRYRHAGREVLSIGDDGTSFDRKLAAQVIPVELHASVSTPQLDPDLCRRILPPHLYEQCCKPKSAAVKPL